MYRATEIQHSICEVNSVSLLTADLYFKNFHFKVSNKKY